MSVKTLEDYINLPASNNRKGEYFGYSETTFLLNKEIPDDTENMRCKWKCLDCKKFFLKSYQLISEGEWCNTCVIKEKFDSIIKVNTIFKVESNIIEVNNSIINSFENISLCMTDEEIIRNYKLIKKPIHQEVKCESNLLKDRYPTIYAQLHPTLNTHLDVTKLTCGSNKKVWFICNLHEKCGQHIYESRIIDRCKKGQDCRYCFGNLICKCQSFLSNPILKEQFVKSLNPDIDPLIVTIFSKIMINWFCKGHKDCNSTCEKHIWPATVDNRSRGTGCPFCAKNSKKTCKCKSVYNNELIRSQFCQELHPDVNLMEVGIGSELALTFKCNGFKTCTSECEKHIWIATINARTTGTGCPFCASGGNCITCRCKSFMNIDLLRQQFDYELNPDIDPWKISEGSHVRFWWKCFICLFIWNTTVHNRTCHDGTNCPECSRNRIESIGHGNMRLYLTNNSISHNGEYKLIEYLPLRRYDFYLNGIKYFLEFDGQQHFIQCTWDNDQKDFLYRQQVDIYKTFIVLIQSFNIIRIQYKEYCDIEKIMNKILSIKTTKPTLFLDNKVKYSFLFGEIDHDYLKILSGDKYEELSAKIKNLDYDVVYYEDL
jgi:very-short-patch-repair endonuclease